MDGREYGWEWTLKDGTEVEVEAAVYGKDTPARGPSYSHGGLPPEYRDVELTVTTLAGEDITDKVPMDELLALWDHAIEMDDEATDYMPEYDDREDED